MSDPTDLTAVRWNRIENPAKHQPVDALAAAARAIEERGSPDHIIVVFGSADNEGTTRHRFFQAGNFNGFEIRGLLKAIDEMIWETTR